MAATFQILTRPNIRKLEQGKYLDKRGRVAKAITEHGITAERMANGDIRYSVNIMENNERVHRVIGRQSTGTTRTQAEEAIAAFKTKAREGRLDLPKGRKTHRTFSEAAAAYLERIKDDNKHGRNYDRKKRHVEDQLNPHFKSQRIDRLSDISVAGYVRQRKQEGAAVATINRELSTLSHFLNRAKVWEWIKSRPVIDKGEEPRKHIVLLTPADQQALMQAAIADQDPLTWLFTAIALGTGMRHSEILRIRWEYIDVTNRRIHLPTAKAGSREQPIPPALAAMLKKEREQLGLTEGWAFPTTRADAKHPHRQTMAEQFRRATIRAKLDPKKVTPHVLRHTAITALVKAGVDLPTIQRISGHKTLAMVLRYTTLSDGHVDASVEKLDAAFSGSFTPILHTPPKLAEAS